MQHRRFMSSVDDKKESMNGYSTATDVNHGLSMDDLNILKNALNAEAAAAPATTPPASAEPSATQEDPPFGLTTEQLAQLRDYLQSDLQPFERDSYWSEVRRHVTEATTMPPEAFRSETFHRVERDKLFAPTWQVAAFTDQLRNAGDVVTANVAGQPVLLVRDRKGEVRGFFNVCRHRGARLVRDCAVQGKKSLACPYHNWGYALDGRLMGTPLWNRETPMSREQLQRQLQAAESEQDVKNFDKGDFGLLPVRVETWGPFVYANVDGEAPPLREYLGRVCSDLEPYPFEDLVTVRQDTVDIRANWKLLAENFMDFYHVPTVHPGYCDVSRFDDHDRSQGDGSYLCHVTYPLTNAGSALDLDKFPHMPGLEGSKHSRTGWFHLHFPNMFYFLYPHSMFIVMIEPTGPTTSTEHIRLMVHKDGLEKAGDQGQAAIQDMWEAYSKVNSEDWNICEECQAGANVQAYKGGRMAWTLEENINRFHKMVANCMTGKPHVIPQADTVLSAFDSIPLYDKDYGEKRKNDE